MNIDQEISLFKYLNGRMEKDTREIEAAANLNNANTFGPITPVGSVLGGH